MPLEDGATLGFQLLYKYSNLNLKTITVKRHLENKYLGCPFRVDNSSHTVFVRCVSHGIQSSQFLSDQQEHKSSFFFLRLGPSHLIFHKVTVCTKFWFLVLTDEMTAGLE